MPRRLLLGSHDIEAFTKKMARWPAVRDLVAALAATGQPPEDVTGRRDLKAETVGVAGKRCQSWTDIMFSIILVSWRTGL
jgi:hypothetical protein